MAQNVFYIYADVLSACCTSGFPDRLVSSVSRTTKDSTRLFPEMTFTCNDTLIVGYTVVVAQLNDPFPVIQIWRKDINSELPVAYNKVAEIEKNDCIHGLTTGSDDRIRHCDLNETAYVTTQCRDILGLEVPQTTLGFATVNDGPTNYVFEELSLSSPVLLSNRSSLNYDFPQIYFDIVSGILVVSNQLHV